MSKITLISLALFSSVTISVNAQTKYKTYKATLFSDAPSADDETNESKYYADDEFPLLPGELELYNPKAPGGLLLQSRPRLPAGSKPSPQQPTPKPTKRPKNPSRRPKPKPKPTGSAGKDPTKKPRKVKVVKTENVKISAPRVTNQGVFPTDATRTKGTFVDAKGRRIDPVNPKSRFYVFGTVNRKSVRKEESLDHDGEHDSFAFNHDGKVTGLTVEIGVTLYTESSLHFEVFSNGTKKLKFHTGPDDITDFDLKWYG